MLSPNDLGVLFVLAHDPEFDQARKVILDDETWVQKLQRARFTIDFDNELAASHWLWHNQPISFIGQTASVY